MSVPGGLSVNLYFALIIFVIVIACFLFLFFNKILDWFVLGGFTSPTKSSLSDH